MSSIRDFKVAFDTNVIIFALRPESGTSHCEILFVERINELEICVPLQVLRELRRNLNDEEMRWVLRTLLRAKSVTWDLAPVPTELVERWESQGAKKGDAVICAHLDATEVRYLISENRHFLIELSELPFRVLSSAQAIALLDEEMQNES